MAQDGEAVSLAGARWLRARSTQAVMQALQGRDAEPMARFVGGCVRNALMGHAVNDIDIATVLTPDAATARLTAAGFKVVPTGIDHGTVTAVVNGKPYEITSLRKDVSTDGRRATVAFTTDWREDAKRRDFTLNALYADLDGTVHDFTEGVSDLRAGHIRFIGDARHRIREDYLRILRFFRMHAWYGEEGFDAIAMDAVEAEREGLTALSGERVQKEILTLLAADNPVPSLDGMAETGVLRVLLPEVISFYHLSALIALEKDLMLPVDGLRRFAALISDQASLPPGLAKRFKLSNAQKDRLGGLLVKDWEEIEGMSGRDLSVMLYRTGIDRSADLALLAGAATGAKAEDVADKLDVMRTFQVPVFPLTGADVMAAGVPEGPKVGETLTALEAWWIERDFQPTAEELKARVKST